MCPGSSSDGPRYAALVVSVFKESSEVDVDFLSDDGTITGMPNPAGLRMGMVTRVSLRALAWPDPRGGRLLDITPPDRPTKRSRTCPDEESEKAAAHVN